MGEHLHGFAPQKKPAQSSPAVRGHDDQITTGLLRGVEDALCRMLILGVHRGTRDIHLARELGNARENPTGGRGGCFLVGTDRKS